MDANQIRAIREQRGIEATHFAFLIGRSSSTVSRYESGQQQPPISTARRIAEVLTEADPKHPVTLDDLFPATEAAA